MNLSDRIPTSPSESTTPTLQQTWESIALQVRFNPAALARDRGVSLRTLQRFFRKHYDMTISEWLRSLRLREAYSRLGAATCVKEVAYDLGYKRASHFSRDFKDFYGIRPSSLCPTFPLLRKVGCLNP